MVPSVSTSRNAAKTFLADKGGAQDAQFSWLSSRVSVSDSRRCLRARPSWRWVSAQANLRHWTQNILTAWPRCPSLLRRTAPWSKALYDASEYVNEPKRCFHTANETTTQPTTLYSCSSTSFSVGDVEICLYHDRRLLFFNRPKSRYAAGEGVPCSIDKRLQSTGTGDSGENVFVDFLNRTKTGGWQSWNRSTRAI